MFTALSERWHEETSRFHLIMLDNMVCLLHIPIEGNILTHLEKIPRERGIHLITELLGVFEHTVIDDVRNSLVLLYPFHG